MQKSRKLTRSMLAQAQIKQTRRSPVAVSIFQVKMPFMHDVVSRDKEDGRIST